MLLKSLLFRSRKPLSFSRSFCIFLDSPNSLQNVVAQEEVYSNFLRECAGTSDLHRGRAVHGKLCKGFLFPSLFINNHVLNFYVKSGDLVSGIKLFDEIPEKNVVSWSALIAGFIQRNYPAEALSLFSQMHFSGAKPNAFTLVSALHACSLSDEIIYLHQIHALILKLGFRSSIFLMNAFMTALIRHGEVGKAFQVFEQCTNRDVVSWNAMMAGYLQFSYIQVPELWYRMNREGVKPDNFTFSSVLTGLAALADIKLGFQVHAQLVKSGHGGEICVGNSLVDMYLKNHNLVDSLRAFWEMSCKDVLSWTQMAAGCFRCGQPGQALEFVGEMKKAGVMPNKFTMATVLNACANLASLEEGRKAHGLKIKLQADMDVCVDNALLDLYAKCGCMDDALVAFNSMRERSTVSWTTMVMGYAQNGEAAKALEIFDLMKVEGGEPNAITFVCALYACSQGGLIEEGWKYFTSMSQNHGIQPEEDHYACMVDLLGRAGRIKEAKELILQMPFEPGALVWKILLGACRIHGDVHTGLHAAERAFDLDRDDSSTYMLLSSMFAGLRNWDGVGMLRELMETRDVRKMPGSSWMEMERNKLMHDARGRLP